jgi:hypothetical protein
MQPLAADFEIAGPAQGGRRAVRSVLLHRARIPVGKQITSRAMMISGF